MMTTPIIGRRTLRQGIAWIFGLNSDGKPGGFVAGKTGALAVQLLVILGSIMIFSGCQNGSAKAGQSMLETALAGSWPPPAFSLQYTEEYPQEYTLEALVDGNGHILISHQRLQGDCMDPTAPACWKTEEDRRILAQDTLKGLVRSFDGLEPGQIPFQAETAPGAARFNLGIYLAGKPAFSAGGSLSHLERYPDFDNLRKQLLIFAGVPAP